MTLSHQHQQKNLHRLMADFAHLEDVQDCDVLTITADSRTCETGSLFLACRSAGNHAPQKSYVENALRSGACAVAIDVEEGEVLGEEFIRYGQSFQCPVFAVANLDQKLGLIAARFYDHPSRDLQLVGITGTNGKTSASQFIAQCLHTAESPCGVIGTLGTGLWGNLDKSLFTTPLAVDVQKMLATIRDQQAATVVMEVSSHGLAQGRVNGVEFDVAVLTNLSRDHLDYHGTMENYAQAKSKLFQLPKIRVGIVNLDDDFGRSLIKSMHPDARCVGYSLELEQAPPGCELISGRIKTLTATGMEIEVTTPNGKGHFQTTLLGRFNASNLLAVLAVLLQLDVPFSDALDRLSKVSAPAGRMEQFGGNQQPLVVVDYAHTPDALEKVLATLREHCVGMLWAVFGCGGDRDKGKRPEMAAIAEALADKVVVTDDNPRTESALAIVQDVVSGFSKIDAIHIEHDREKAIQFAIQSASANDMVLIAGKGHEDYQIIGNERHYFSDRAVVLSCLQEAA